MSNKIILGVLAILLSSCMKINHTDIVYTEVKNEELKNQICLYENFVDSVEPNKEKLIYVTFNKINDSITHFEISYYLYDYTIKSDLNFNFICKIKDRDILFIDAASRIRYYNNYFKLDSVARIEIVKRNFPHEYRISDVDADGHQILLTHDPDDFRLTFINGKLKTKSIEMGLWVL